MNDAAENGKIVGQTKDTGFQIGARKTFAVSPQQAWDVLTSTEGIELWLGDGADFRLEPGETYRTADGAKGQVRVVKPGGHFRLTWQPKDWPRASLIQVRVMPSGDKTVISFHQEHLHGPKEREEMRQRWHKVLGELQSLLNS